MVQIISNGIKTLLEQANSVVQTMSIEAAAERFDKTDYVFVDLRDIREIHRSGKIPGAFSCPRGMLEFWIDPESPYHKDVFNQDKTFVFYLNKETETEKEKQVKHGKERKKEKELLVRSPGKPCPLELVPSSNDP